MDAVPCITLSLDPCFGIHRDLEDFVATSRVGGAIDDLAWLKEAPVLSALFKAGVHQ